MNRGAGYVSTANNPILPKCHEQKGPFSSHPDKSIEYLVIQPAMYWGRKVTSPGKRMSNTMATRIGIRNGI